MTFAQKFLYQKGLTFSCCGSSSGIFIVMLLKSVTDSCYLTMSFCLFLLICSRDSLQTESFWWGIALLCWGRMNNIGILHDFTWLFNCVEDELLVCLFIGLATFWCLDFHFTCCLMIVFYYWEFYLKDCWEVDFYWWRYAWFSCLGFRLWLFWVRSKHE